MDFEDNIVALATARGVGSVDIIRISGATLVPLYKSITKILLIKNIYILY